MNGLTTIDMDSAMGTQPRTPNRRHSKSVGADSFPDSTPRNLPRPPPKKHSHHQPVTKFNTDMWKESFRRSCMDRLFKEERFKAYQKRRGLDAMDTSDDVNDERLEYERQQELIRQVVSAEYQTQLALASQNPAFAQYLTQQGVLPAAPPLQNVVVPTQAPQELVQTVAQQIGHDVSLGQVAEYVHPGIGIVYRSEPMAGVVGLPAVNPIVAEPAQQQLQPFGPQWSQWR